MDSSSNNIPGESMEQQEPLPLDPSNLQQAAKSTPQQTEAPPAAHNHTIPTELKDPSDHTTHKNNSVINSDRANSSALPQNKHASKQPNPFIFNGSVSLWMGWRALTGSGVTALCAAAVLVFGAPQTTGFINKVLVIGGSALLAASLLMIPYLIISIRSLTYKISETLVERERGLLFKRVDSLDLYRIKDVQLRQNILQRMLKVGTIEIYSSDQSDPHMLIEDIPSPRDVYEKLRNAMIQQSQKRSVMYMDR